MLDQSRIQAYIAKAQTELLEHILPFWIRYAVDKERGGFYGSISNTLVVDRDAPKGALLCSRILWTYSAAYRRYRSPAYLEMANLAYADLLARFWDDTYSGLYWMVDADGNPANTRKHIFGQAFGIYALAEYYRATGAAAALEKAIALFEAIEVYSYDRKHKGYFEAYTRDWRLDDDMRLSATDQNEKKSLNTHLHVLEAYTNLLQVWDNPELRRRQAELIKVLLRRVIHPTAYHARAFFDERWNVRSTRISFGHTIETSWLLVEAAEALGDCSLIKAASALAVNMAQATYIEGLDVDGGLFYEGDRGGFLNLRKEWWPQAEAVVGFINAYQLSSRQIFLDAALGCWDFIERRLVDRAHGEWFKYAIDGRISDDEPKVSFWKCPYHNSRACMQMIERLQAVLEAAA
jgi:cellobiose epimerase